MGESYYRGLCKGLYNDIIDGWDNCKYFAAVTEIIVDSIISQAFKNSSRQRQRRNKITN